MKPKHDERLENDMIQQSSDRRALVKAGWIFHAIGSFYGIRLEPTFGLAKAEKTIDNEIYARMNNSRNGDEKHALSQRPSFAQIRKRL